jgi:hypothetical protein
MLGSIMRSEHFLWGTRSESYVGDLFMESGPN